MNLEPGMTLLHYRIVDKIGEGGMGVVWKALDTTLDRTVAIKVLPASFGEEPERLARFEREAKSLASLNHPNVASLFGLHEFEGARFITMEFVEGEDLSKRIQRGALPVEEAVPIAIGIAEALSTAHARGIVHRDLKPANVLIDPEGTPKVLDFGLAKMAMPDTMSGGGSGSGSDPSASPTITSLGTVAGVLLGTAAYMSPEQARGKPVDKRADTWALGCILYEMLAGKTPFPGETISDTLAAVLKTEPDWEALPASTPASIRTSLKRSLAKKARDRWQDAGDLRYELERSLDDSGDAVATVATESRRGVTPLAIGLLVAGLVMGAVLRHVWAPPPASAETDRQPTLSEISAPEGVAFGAGSVSLALSHDGTQLAFSGVGEDGITRLYHRPLTGSVAKPLPGTEGASYPFWSPAGDEIGYYAEGVMYRIGPEDPQPKKITEDGGLAGAWNADGLILYCQNTVFGAVQTVDVETGKRGELPHTKLGDGSCNSVTFLPDGQHFIYEARDSSLDAGLFLARLGSEEVTRLNDLKTNALYSSGHMLFHDGPDLLAQRLDPHSYEPAGEPFVVASPVFDLNFPFHAIFAAARDRARLVYLEGTGESLQTELIWFARDGRVVERTGIVGDLYNPSLSKDSRRLLLDVSTYETEGDIWWFDLVRGSQRRLTDDPIDESLPVWSPDERTVYFFRNPDLYKIDLQGSGEPVLILDAPHSASTNDVTTDGMVLFDQSNGNDRDIEILDPVTSTVTPWLATSADEWDGNLSPDNRWIAYSTAEGGVAQVYVDRFPEPGERFKVTRDGGTNARWRGDGRELYYASLTGEIVAVPVDFESDSRPLGDPQVLFRSNMRRDMFIPHPDGDRFLVVERLDPKIHRAILVDDWN